MELSQLPDFATDEQGVTFRYLVFRVVSQEREKILVRGLNYLPYDAQLNQRIVNRTVDELEQAGFDSASGQVLVEGGGTITLNPYYETVTVFGENPEYGEEADREAVKEIVKKTYPGYELSSFKSGEELAPPAKPKRPAKKEPAADEAEAAEPAESAGEVEEAP